MTDDTTPAPITIKATAAPVVMSEATKLVLIAGFAMAAEHFIRSESVMAAVMAASGVVVTGLYGVWRRIQTWGVLKHLAGFVDDSIARVGRPK